MCSDTFSTALPHLRPHTNSPTPQIYSHLAHLLTQYTTGLSLPITLDSLSTLSQVPSRPAFMEATVISTHHHPTIHVLKSAKKYLALYPPAHQPPLPPSTTLLLPFPSHSSEALSLAQNLIPDHPITHAILPTQNIVIRLPFPHKLPNPLQFYTLLSVWQNRDLTPSAVYAKLIQSDKEDSSLVLVDQSPHSPSVLLKLSRARHQLPRILPVPCNLLITTPTVTPSENSFTLHDTPLSTIFYQPLPKVNAGNKRKKPSSTSHTLHAARDLEELQRDGDCNDPITVHTRVDKVDTAFETIVTTCENVCITVPKGDYEKGDELLLKRVTYRNRWVAEEATNISTMQGVLHCPFVRKFVSIKHAMRSCRGEYTTAHIKVIIEGAIKQGEFVELSVVDAAKREAGDLHMKARGFQELFEVSREGFLQIDRELVTHKVRQIQGVVWLMAVTCGVADLPILTACLKFG